MSESAPAVMPVLARHRLVIALVAAIVAGLLVGLSVLSRTPPAGAAPAGVSPVVQRNAHQVSADALPTAQMNGVAWASATVGSTVYVGGNFSLARPAGAPAGTDEVARGNLMAFDINTGVMTSWAPSANAQIKAVAVSPDKSRIYVGGSFTAINGVAEYRLAAFSTATGALITSFHVSLNATVNAITVTNDAVYAGGVFTQDGSKARSHLAAFDPATGHALDWAPTADATVNAMVASPDGTRIIVGGIFETLNGVSAYGLGALGPHNARTYPWAANTVVRDAGSGASILSLTTDGNAVYSTAYVYTDTGNFEGVLSANPDTGAINWLADCHGDTYDTFGVNNTVYVVSHMHYCSNIGGFPDSNPRSIWYRSTAFTAQATGTVQTNGETGPGYGNFAGQPSPSLINWLPDLTIGTVTGQNQAAWTVTGNSTYVVEGGEFPEVNGVAQQGLVRFAIPSVAPDKVGPHNIAVDLTATGQSPSTVSLSWPTDYDIDDGDLTYSIYRSDQATPLYVTSSVSAPWNLPTLQWTDQSVQANKSYSYKLVISDPSGNTLSSTYRTVTTPVIGIPSPFVPSAPSTPVLPAASGLTNSAIMSWSAAAGAQIDSYTVRASSDGGATWNAATISPAGTATRVTVGNLLGGRSYVFEVAAVNGGGTSGWSAPTAAVSIAGGPKVAPTAHIDAPKTAKVGQKVLFHSVSVVHNPGAKIIAHHWRIGKHTYIHGNPITFAFRVPGRYQVFLAVYDSAGSKGTTSVYITVSR